MSELSRNQVEALRSTYRRWARERGEVTYGSLLDFLAPTVAAMLDERDRQARAEVVRDVEAVHHEDGSGFCEEDGHIWPCATARTIARHASAAAGAPLTAQDGERA